MKNKDLMRQLEQVQVNKKIKQQDVPHLKHNTSACVEFSVQKYLEFIKKQDPNAIVMVSNGDCEDDGVYAQSTKEGAIDFRRCKPFREGDPFPDDEHDWVRVAYLPEAPRPSVGPCQG